VSTAAHAHSPRLTRRAPSRALNGNANSNADTRIGCTRISEPNARAAACRAYPATAAPVPIHHSRRRTRVAIITVLTPFSGGTSMVARWRTTMPTAANTAAHTASSTASPWPSTTHPFPAHVSMADNPTTVNRTRPAFSAAPGSLPDRCGVRSSRDVSDGAQMPLGPTRPGTRGGRSRRAGRFRTGCRRVGRGDPVVDGGHRGVHPLDRRLAQITDAITGGLDIVGGAAQIGGQGGAQPFSGSAQPLPQPVVVDVDGDVGQQPKSHIRSLLCTCAQE